MTFDEWFDKEYPESFFGTQPLAMRAMFREISEKAFNFGLQKKEMDDFEINKARAKQMMDFHI